jgi:hypothetical protein
MLKVVFHKTPDGKQSGVAERDDCFRVGLELLEKLVLMLDEFVDLGRVSLTTGSRGLIW